MADLAIVQSAPAGTQRKTVTDGYWVDAQVDDKLQAGDEIQNTQSNAYGLELLPVGCIVFESIGTVTLSGIEGTVKYYDSNNEWVTVTSSDNYNAKAVGTDNGSGVVIVCARKGKAKIGPWPANP
jgi:hypothetical protein